MARRLFRALSAVSLVLCVMTTVLWVRSGSVEEQVSISSRVGRLSWVESSKGRVRVVVVEGWPVSEPLRYVREPRVGFDGGKMCMVVPGFTVRSRLGVRVVEGTAHVEVRTKGPPLLSDEDVAALAGRSTRFMDLDFIGPHMSGWWGKHDGAGGLTLDSPPRPLWMVHIPHDLATAVFAVLPVTCAGGAARRAATRRRRSGGGMCVGCGYDLTGNVSGACPECGDHAV